MPENMPENMIDAFPVLLAGGSGTRLWPVSREMHPKQLACFFSDATLIQNTIQRVLPLLPRENVRIVCGRSHLHEIRKNLLDMGVDPEEKIIDEPSGRNTAPAILLAVLEIMKTRKNPLIFIFPADHVIGDPESFREKMAVAADLAKNGAIVTFGIRPGYPETGYGYIEASQDRMGEGFRIRRFVEKPDSETARAYVDAGNFYWNSGMFAFRGDMIKEEFRRFNPRLLEDLEKLVSDPAPLTRETYDLVESISIDYAVMEKTDKGVVLPSDFQWSDIGSWKSLYDFLPKDENENVIAAGDVILQNTKHAFVMGHERLIAVNGMENIVVVETPDSVFVSDITNSRDVKHIVAELKKTGRRECRIHTKVHHPWGYEKVLERTAATIIKRLEIYFGEKTPDKVKTFYPRQCFVLEGTGTARISGKEFRLEKGFSFSLEEDEVFQIENTGVGNLQVMEIENRKQPRKP